MRKSTISVGGMLVAAMLVTAGCTADGNDPTGGGAEVAEGFLAVADDSLEAGGTLRIDLDYDSVEVNGLDPATADTARSWMIMGLAYDSLLGIGPDFEPVPQIAESWEVVSPTEYTFDLRADATFSNGRVVTPEDVKGSLERLQTSGGAWSGQVAVISSIEVTGERQVTITLSEPFTPLLGVLAHSNTSILPMAEIEAGDFDPTAEMLGSGAWVATEHTQDESWTFEPNEHYYDAAAVGIEQLELRIVPDEATRLASIRDGSAQYVFFNNADAIDLLSGTPTATVVNQQNTDFFFMMLNSKDPESPLSDERVRFAVNAIADRAQLIELATAGTAQPTGVAPASLPDACDPADLPSQQLSDDDIRALLADAGAEGITLSLATWNSETGPGQIAQVLQQQLAEFDITLDVQIIDDGVWAEGTYGDPEVPMVTDLSLSWYAGYGDASIVTSWWRSTAGFTARWMSGSEEQDALITAAAQAPAGAERSAAFTALCASVDESSEQVPLMNRPGVIAYRSDMVSPTINTDEGYGDILRYLSDFRMIPGS
jgi:peptide/nickel transport system substrate-binding protein